MISFKIVAKNKRQMKRNSICYEIGGMGLGDGYKENGVCDRLEETLCARKWQYV